MEGGGYAEGGSGVECTCETEGHDILILAWRVRKEVRMGGEKGT